MSAITNNNITTFIPIYHEGKLVIRKNKKKMEKLINLMSFGDLSNSIKEFIEASEGEEFTNFKIKAIVPLISSGDEKKRRRIVLINDENDFSEMMKLVGNQQQLEKPILFRLMNKNKLNVEKKEKKQKDMKERPKLSEEETQILSEKKQQVETLKDEIKMKKEQLKTIKSEMKFIRKSFKHVNSPTENTNTIQTTDNVNQTTIEPTKEEKVQLRLEKKEEKKALTLEKKMVKAQRKLEKISFKKQKQQETTQQPIDTVIETNQVSEPTAPVNVTVEPTIIPEQVQVADQDANTNENNTAPISDLKLQKKEQKIAFKIEKQMIKAQRKLERQNQKQERKERKLQEKQQVSTPTAQN